MFGACQVSGDGIVGVLAFNLLRTRQHRRGLRQPAERIVSIVYGLVPRVRYAGYGAAQRIRCRGYHFAPRVRLRFRICSREGIREKYENRPLCSARMSSEKTKGTVKMLRIDGNHGRGHRLYFLGCHRGRF